MPRKSAGAGCDLLIKGDLVKIELIDGDIIQLPDDWGMAHDPFGVCMPKCTFVVCPYVFVRTVDAVPDEELRILADAYFGKGYPLFEAMVELPTGPWQRVGQAAQIYYARHGKIHGLFHHPYKDREDFPVMLDVNRKQTGYRIHMPDGCIVNAHGFVFP